MNSTNPQPSASVKDLFLLASLVAGSILLAAVIVRLMQ
jgi:hypothetical protein